MQIKVRYLEEFKEFISSLPRNARGEATKAGGKYLIGNDRRGLKHYPKRVQHGENNPYQWQSEKQRRKYFATKGFGEGIPYTRKNRLADGWTQIEDGVNSKVVNSVPYAKYVVGDDQQRGHAADKWRKVGKVIEDNMKGMIQAMQQAVDRWIKNRKK